jgi:chemotaxis protein MotA
MFVAIGWLVVLGAIIGSFVGAGGHIAVLLQPFEFMCILGSAGGAFVVANPMKTVKATIAEIPGVFAGPAYNKKKYLSLIALLYELLQKVRMQGMLAMEPDISNPAESPLFMKYPAVLKDHHLLDFILDYFRMMVEGNVDRSAVEDLMTAELDTHHEEAMAPSNAVQMMADGLPAFGIVAAVMGVVHTMGSVGAPPPILGEMIAEALVGTFLGILCAYGFVQPLSSAMASKAVDAAIPYECIKAVLLAYLNGSTPSVAVEFGRKVLFSNDRPTFTELDDAMREAKNGPAPPPADDVPPAPAEPAAAAA